MASLLRRVVRLPSKRVYYGQPGLSCCRPATTVAGMTNPYHQSLLRSPETRVTRLPSGLRVASEDTGSETVTVGYYVDVGTRVENERNNGMAHFFEHMAFKGTKNRHQRQLNLEVENMGAQLNAYTSREQTVFFSRSLREHLPDAVDMLSDLLQNPLVNERDVEEERGVILREMQEIDNTMIELTLDHLHAVAFQGTPLAQTILGPEENIRSLKRQELVDFVKAHYRAPRMVLAAAGGVDHDQLVKLASKHWGNASQSVGAAEPSVDPPVPNRFTGEVLHLPNDDMQLAHVALAVEGCSWTDPDSFALQVACSVLGEWNRSQPSGPRATSRLVEKLSRVDGGCHEFSALLPSYSDTGLFAMYFVAEPLALEHTVQCILEEWRHLCTSITDEEVQRAVHLRKAHHFSSLDGSTAICDEVGRQMIVYNRRMSQLELSARYDAVNADWVREACSRRILNQSPALVAIGPISSLPSHESVCNTLKS